MKIPARLLYLLERDQELDGAVKLAISSFEPWIKHSNLPFFPEYTKHDIEHIEAVLFTAVALIRDEAWETVTPADAAVLVVSVLLHDCAMHLSEDGFFSLFEESRRERHVSGLADKPWHVLWEDFLREASRFDSRRLMRLFGDDLPIRRPPIDVNQLTMRDRLLVGEFLRRHHARLAHEIALFGVPMRGGSRLSLESLSGAREFVASIAGVVARSHGADVRELLPFLKQQFDVREYKLVHPVFLMALLRVADFLQIEATRAPASVLQVRELTSPVSVGEFKAHHAIKDVRHTHEDPEAIYVDALPASVDEFLRVESWLRGIQHELDASWAVLGEIFGRYPELNKLGLKLRRVRSSLDEVHQLSKKISYLPLKARFRTADSDLLKLLIEPLYGDRPEVGLRELIQNAVDAVNELQQYKRDLDLQNVSVTNQEAAVVVSVAKSPDGQSWVRVSDLGIGMTARVVTEFFLTAGASFRRTEDWKRVFEDDDGRSKVLRAGRFGVGALACFLLGPEIEVTTRHVDDEEGLAFSARIDSDTIELRRFMRPVGTEIKIKISAEMAERLGGDSEEPFLNPGERWDWYCLPSPTVKRFAFGKELPAHLTVPSLDSPLPNAWRRISHPGFSGVLWTYGSSPPLVCNGIKIVSYRDGDDVNARSKTEAAWDHYFGLRRPNVAVFDPDGRLPLNLQRTELTTKGFPFERDLADDVIRDFIAYAITNAPDARPKLTSQRDTIEGVAYPGSSRRMPAWMGHPQCGDWYFTDQGIGYLDGGILSRRRFTSVLLLRGNAEFDLAISPRYQPSVFVSDGDNLRDLDAFVRWLFESVSTTSPSQADIPKGSSHVHEVLDAMKRTGASVLLRQRLYDRAKKSLPKRLLDRMKIEWRSGEWLLIRMGECGNQTFDFRGWANAQGEVLGMHSVVAEVSIDPTYEPDLSPVGSKWLEYIGCTEIPFDSAERRTTLKTAYDSLTPYIRAHEETKAAAALAGKS